MQIDRRITNGLAWAGVFLVVGVPAADILSAQFMPEPQVARAEIAMAPPAAPVPAPASQRPAAPALTQTAAVKPAVPAVEKPVEVGAVAPAPTVAPSAPAAKPVQQVAATTPAAKPAGGAVDTFMQSGKPLPSYITGAGQKPAPQAATVLNPAATPPVNATPTSAIAPNPVTTASTAPAVVTDPVTVASIPAKVAPVPMPLSMRPQPITIPTTSQQAIVLPAQEQVVIPNRPAPMPDDEITSADLEDWETGPLSDFLARRNGQAQSGYEDDGYYVEPPARRDRIVGPVDDDVYYPFGY